MHESCRYRRLVMSLRPSAALFAAALLVGACAATTGERGTQVVVSPPSPVSAVTAPRLTAPPALQSVPTGGAQNPLPALPAPAATTTTPLVADSPAAANGSAGDPASSVAPTSPTPSTEPPTHLPLLPSTTSLPPLSPPTPPSPQTAVPPSRPSVPPSTPSVVLPLAETKFALVPVAEVPAPIALAARPDTGQRYVASRLGEVWLLDPADGSSEPQQVADISDKISQGCENGLLGMAFSRAGDRLYLSYTDTARNSRIAVVPLQGEIPQTDSARILLALSQPACNHNGGDLHVGPDGNLWIGFGDGGGADDVFGQGQDRNTLLGTLVRIDPDPPTGRGYGIPAGNPFVSGSAPEVWAYGARNPWRFSFDRLSGDLWIADVGQNRFEEIHVLTAADGWSAGANLGWPLFEGSQRFSGEVTPADLVFPVYTYPHDDGCSVTGGYVYRGNAMEALAGVYVFGDYCTGEIWRLVRGVDDNAERLDLGVSVPRNTLVSFGEDADGELYVLSAAGTVFRLEAAAP